jgi:RNA-splicing ligase RtcB
VNATPNSPKRAEPSRTRTRCRLEKAKNAGAQNRTLGSGNHFLEVQYVERVDRAKLRPALSEGQIVAHPPARWAVIVCTTITDLRR